MKYLNVKIAALILSLFTVLALSGCGSSGTSSNNELVGGEPVAAPVVATPYEIAAHHGSEAVVHSHVEPSPEGHEYTHEWTQVSGPTVALTTTTEPTTTFVTPAVAPPPVDSGKPQVTPPHEITAHHDTEVVVHSQVAPSPEGHEYTHEWTQVSGPTVALTTTTEPTTTFVTPAGTTEPVVLKHTVTNTQTGQTTTTHHTVKPAPATTALSVTVSKPAEVKSGATASLHASASGGDGSYTYVWTQTAGTKVTLDLAHSFAPTFVAPALNSVPSAVSPSETLTFSVTVKDGTGKTVSATETITVIPAAIPQPVVLKHTVTNTQTGQTTESHHAVKPVPETTDLSVVVSKPFEVKSGATTSLHASASGGDGSYTYVWTQKTGSHAVFHDSSHLSAPHIQAPHVSTSETLEFSVKVTDGNGETVSATETITVVPVAEPPSANTPPVANAGPDQHVKVGDVVKLDGTGSSDADGDTLHYNWAIVHQPHNSLEMLSDQETAHPTFTAATEGTYLIHMRVNDGKKDSGFDSVTITVSP